MPGDFDEAKHKRAEDGKFTHGDGGGAAEKPSRSERARAAARGVKAKLREKAAPAPKAKRSYAKGAKFDAKPHEKKIAKFRTQEAKFRTQSIALKAKMAALKVEARAKAKTPAQKARFKARFEKLAAKREELKAKASAAKTGRVDARKAMQAAKKEHRAGRKTAREEAKASRVQAKRDPSVPWTQRKLVRTAEGAVRSKLISQLSPSDVRAEYRERQAARDDGAPAADGKPATGAEPPPVWEPKKNPKRVEAAKKAAAASAERRREVHSAVASNLPQELQTAWARDGHKFMQEEASRVRGEKDRISAASKLSEAFAEQYASSEARGYEGDKYHRRTEIEAEHAESWADEQERKYYEQASRAEQFNPSHGEPDDDHVPF